MLLVIASAASSAKKCGEGALHFQSRRDDIYGLPVLITLMGNLPGMAVPMSIRVGLPRYSAEDRKSLQV